MAVDADLQGLKQTARAEVVPVDGHEAEDIGVRLLGALGGSVDIVGIDARGHSARVLDEIEAAFVVDVDAFEPAAPDASVMGRYGGGIAERNFDDAAVRGAALLRE